MTLPLVALTDATVTFGGRPAFDGLSVGLGAGERVCLVGRNGSGKSTLMRALAGEIELDGGSRFVQPGTRIAYLPQEPRFGGMATVADYVATGLPADAGAAGPGRVASVLDALRLAPDAEPGTLSGGEARRADLARLLAADADVLLLDEPTNHLDIDTILWLERELGGQRGALLMISHDRAFLGALSRRTWWLDRGQARRREAGYPGFEDWAEQVLAAEAQAVHRDQRKLVAETKWLREGLSARRKRNEGRVRALQALRRSLTERDGPVGRAKLAVSEAEGGGSLVIEAEHVDKAFDRPVVRDFSIKIKRGARIGVIGPNGAGKTTLIRLLTGELAPDRGRIRLGVGLEAAYFDQRRAALDPERSVAWALTDGSGDQVMVDGRPRHVVSYLKDFLFTDVQAMSPVKALSGGERARLLLAKLFARPSNLLILDEPTNDLDMDTLDLLEDVLGDYGGTVLAVSHDRDFLDRIATSVIALDGTGRAVEYAGGYTDYLAQRPPPVAAPPPAPKPARTAEPRPAARRDRLSYKDERERQLLPDRIAGLEAEIAKLEADLGDPALYRRDAGRFAAAAERVAAARAELASAEERWLELELLAEQARG